MSKFRIQQYMEKHKLTPLFEVNNCLCYWMTQLDVFTSEIASLNMYSQVSPSKKDIAYAHFSFCYYPAYATSVDQKMTDDKTRNRKSKIFGLQLALTDQ